MVPPVEGQFPADAMSGWVGLIDSGSPQVGGEHVYLVPGPEPPVHDVPAGELVAPVVMRGVHVSEY
jgi:hypothetical protein